MSQNDGRNRGAASRRQQQQQQPPPIAGGGDGSMAEAWFGATPTLPAAGDKSPGGRIGVVLVRLVGSCQSLDRLQWQS